MRLKNIIFFFMFFSSFCLSFLVFLLIGQKVLGIRLGSDIDMGRVYKIINLPPNPFLDNELVSKGWVLGQAGSARLRTKKVFVTSQKFTGNLGGMSGADAKCQTAADAAGLGGTWKAFLGRNPTERYERLNDNWDILVGVHNRPIITRWERERGASVQDIGGIGCVHNQVIFDENGNRISLPAYVWLGSWGLTCQNWTTESSSIKGGVGEFSIYDDGLGCKSFSSYTDISCNQKAHLYCIQQ